MNYFITFRTYGTWLHGDERGAVDQRHNQVGEPLLESHAGLRRYRRARLQSEPALLDEKCRACVETTIHEVADHRDWSVLALHVLVNHVHVVITTPDDVPPKKALNDFKSWATRRLREQELVPQGVRIWAEHGSTRYLNTAESVHAACHYVTHCQGNEPA